MLMMPCFFFSPCMRNKILLIKEILFDFWRTKYPLSSKLNQGGTSLELGTITQRGTPLNFFYVDAHSDARNFAFPITQKTLLFSLKNSAISFQPYHPITVKYRILGRYTFFKPKTSSRNNLIFLPTPSSICFPY